MLGCRRWRACCRLRGRRDPGILGLYEGVRAGGFEGAVELTQGPVVPSHDLATQPPQGHCCLGHFLNLPVRRRLRPGHSVLK